MSTEKKAETAPKPEAPATPPGSHIPVADVLKSTFSDKNNLMALLAAAGASGLLGGYVSSKSLKRPGETPGQRRVRILANALGAGAAGGGAVGAGMLGAKMLASRTEPQPGFFEKAYDKTIGRAPAFVQAGGIIGGVGGTYAGARTGLKDLAAERSQSLKNLFSYGQDVPKMTGGAMPAVSEQDIMKGLARHADPSLRAHVINSLRGPVNPTAAGGIGPHSLSQLKAMDQNTERLIEQAGLRSQLSLGAKAKLRTGNAGQVAMKATKGGLKGIPLGAAGGLGVQLLVDFLSNKAGQ